MKERTSAHHWAKSSANVQQTPADDTILSVDILIAENVSQVCIVPLVNSNKE